MKRTKKVFFMTEHELRSTLNSVLPEGNYLTMTKSDMQEELINWLLNKELTVSHEFLLYEDEDGVIWLLDKGTNYCKCCKNKKSDTQNEQRNSPFEVVIYRNTSLNNTNITPNITTTSSNKVSPIELSVRKLPADVADRKVSRPLPKDRKNNSKNNSNNVITQQPLPSGQKVPNLKLPGKKETLKKEKKPGTCKQCCIECGTCCVGLLNSS